MYQKISEIIKNRSKAAICLIVETKGSTPRKTGTKMIVYENGSIEGTIGGGSLEKKVIEDAINIQKANKPQLFEYKLQQDLSMGCGGCVSIFIEPINFSPKLIIFGAGHIGKALANFASQLDFDISIIDERDGIFNTWQEGNFQKINQPYKEALETITFDDETYITVVSHTHELDFMITGFCAKQKFAFLGTIASKKKSAKFHDDYISNGVLTEDEFTRINMPMGIAINCETPEEIAISIIAKIIDVRRKRTEN